ncbi:hypothetical protein ACIGO9_31275 [Nocardia asteroides]|uniref:hypothetical protein n=1 Tax=Nocardia asteroides TaxID=1824 RepID=UPI0037CA4F04
MTHRYATEHDTLDLYSSHDRGLVCSPRAPAQRVLDADAAMRSTKWSKALGVPPFPVEFITVPRPSDPPAEMVYLYGEPMAIDVDARIYAQLEPEARDALIAREIAGAADAGVSEIHAAPGPFAEWFRAARRWRVDGNGALLDLAGATGVTASTVLAWSTGANLRGAVLAAVWLVIAVLVASRLNWAAEQRMIGRRCDRLAARVVGVHRFAVLFDQLAYLQPERADGAVGRRLNPAMSVRERRVALGVAA